MSSLVLLKTNSTHGAARPAVSGFVPPCHIALVSKLGSWGSWGSWGPGVLLFGCPCRLPVTWNMILESNAERVRPDGVRLESPKSTRKPNTRWPWMPYTIAVSAARSPIPLNRDYHPLHSITAIHPSAPLEPLLRNS